MELKLLWCGYALEDGTALLSEDHEEAVRHALSDAPDGEPTVVRFLCAVTSPNVAMIICAASGEVVPLGAPVKLPGIGGR